MKKFDCVEMKQKAQEKVLKETRSLSQTEEIEYFKKAGDRFWNEMKKQKAGRSRKSTSGNSSGVTR